MKNIFTYLLLLAIAATVILIFPFFSDFTDGLQDTYNEKKGNVVTEYERVKGKIVAVNEKIQDTKDKVEDTIDTVGDVVDTAGGVLDKIDGVIGSDEDSPDTVLLVYDENRDFSEEEVAQIEDMVVSPFVLYYADSERPVVKVQISKTDSAPDVLATYHFSYSRNADTMGIGGGFGISPVKAQSGTIEDYLIWCPSCYFIDCRGNSDDFQDAYPEIHEMALNGCQLPE